MTPPNLMVIINLPFRLHTWGCCMSFSTQTGRRKVKTKSEVLVPFRSPALRKRSDCQVLPRKSQKPLNQLRTLRYNLKKVGFNAKVSCNSMNSFICRLFWHSGMISWAPGTECPNLYVLMDGRGPRSDHLSLWVSWSHLLTPRAYRYYHSLSLPVCERLGSCPRACWWWTWSLSSMSQASAQRHPTFLAWILSSSQLLLEISPRVGCVSASCQEHSSCKMTDTSGLYIYLVCVL